MIQSNGSVAKSNNKDPSYRYYKICKRVQEPFEDKIWDFPQVKLLQKIKNKLSIKATMEPCII